MLTFIKDKHLKTFRCKDFMDLYGSLSAEEKEILTDACKIFVIKGKDVALAKGEYSNFEDYNSNRFEDCKKYDWERLVKWLIKFIN